MARTKSKQATAQAVKHREPARGGSKLPITKQDLMIDLLKRRRGASINDLTEATGWQRHSVRGAISGTLMKKRGLTIISTMEEDRGRVYRIADVA